MSFTTSFARTSSLTFLPSTVLPASRAITAFITLPMSLALVAPVSAIAAATARVELVVADRRRQVGLEHRDLGLLLVGEVLRPPAVNCSIESRRCLTRRRHDLQLLGAFERAVLLDALVHERGLQHAQRGQARRVLGLHRGGDVGAESVRATCDSMLTLDSNSELLNPILSLASRQ